MSLFATGTGCTRSGATGSIGLGRTSGSRDVFRAQVRALGLSGGANVQDINDPNNPISVMGGGSIEVNLHGYGEPVTGDTVAVTVYDKNNRLCYSSNWSGAMTLEHVLDGGKLVVIV